MRPTSLIGFVSLLSLVTACGDKQKKGPEPTTTSPATAGECEQAEAPQPRYEPCDGQPFSDPWENWGRVSDADKAFGARRISVGPTIEEAGGDSPAMSLDGRFVAFVSTAPIHPGDTNGKRDVYLRDRSNNRTYLASPRIVQHPGDEFPTITAGNDSSDEPAISADGCIIAFSSRATDLVPNDTNGKPDVFAYDRCRGRVELVSRKRGLDGYEPFPSIGASWGPSISADGRYIAFSSESTDLVAGDTPSGGVTNLYLWDRQARTMRRLTKGLDGAEPNGPSTDVVINALGTRVAFASTASNLVAGDTNGKADIFYRDLADGAPIQLASVGAAGQRADGHSLQPAISLNGEVIAFATTATNLTTGDPLQLPDTNDATDVYVRNTRFATTRRVSLSWGRAYRESGAIGEWVSVWEEYPRGTVSSRPAIDASGTRVAYTATSALAIAASGPGDYDWCITNLWDTNGVSDVIVAELRAAGDLPVANQYASVTQAFPAPNRSPEEKSTNPIWTFERELGNGASRTDSTQLFTLDGRTVVFTSLATNLAGIDAGRGAYQNQYLCQVNPKLRAEKMWRPIPNWSKSKEGYDVFVNSLDEPGTFLCSGLTHFPPRQI